MNAIVKTEPKLMLLDFMADKYSLKPDEFGKTVRATCGLSTATPEQVAAFLVVAKQYDLNPLTREIYAFPGRSGGIVPIVSIDGWVNLVNSNPNCDGFEFQMDHDGDGKLVSCTCTMYRKDRKHPVSVTEYLSECVRPTDPWKMRHRMLRHKAMIQAARYAFGFAGIYDEDEGRTIADADAGPRDAAPPRNVQTIEHDPTPPEATATVTVDIPKVRRISPYLDEVVQKPKPEDAPRKIVGGTYATWADAFIEAVQSAGEASVVMAWIDANRQQLDKLAKGSPDDAARARTAMAKHIEFLRKTAPPTPSEPQGDVLGQMGGESAPAPEKPPTARRRGRSAVPDFAKDYDGWMTFNLDRISKAASVDDLETIFGEVDAVWDDLMPPDKTALSEARSAAEDRIAP